MKRCPNCLKHFSDDANFCPVDAGRLEADSAEAAPTADANEALGGRFTLGSRVGGELTGEVYEATDSTTGQSCIVKLVDSKVFPTPLLMQRTERELKQLERLQAQGVAKVLGHGKRGDRLWIASEQIHGTQLGELVLSGGPLEAQRAAKLILSIGKALAEAAKLGVIHRDLAPKNILVGDGDAIKVINFGVAVPATEKIQGVAEFVAPELIEGKPVDQRSNIYSLGALLYFLLSGRPPYEGTTEEVHEAHTADTPPPDIETLAPNVRAFLFKALERTSAKRFMTLRQLLGELEKASAGPMTVEAQAPVAATPAPVAAAPAPEAAKPMAQIVEAAAGKSARKNKQMAQTLIGMAPLGAATEQNPALAVSPPVAAGGGFEDDATQPVDSLSAEPAEEPKTVPGAPPEDLLRQSSEAPATDIMDKAPVTVPPAAAAAEAAANLAPALVAPPAVDPQSQIATASAQSYGLGPETSANRAGKPDSSTVPATGKRAKRAKRAKARAQSADKAKFRETMWFKKGELDAEAAAHAAKGKDDKALDKADAMPMEDRYSDDGSITDRDRDRLSLRTGDTASRQAVRAARDSAGPKVSEQELLDEMTGGRKNLIIAGVVVAIAVVVVIVLLAT
jgi:serine/threonine-protein kinase